MIFLSPDRKNGRAGMALKNSATVFGEKGKKNTEKREKIW